MTPRDLLRHAIGLTPRERAQAAWLWSRRRAVIAGNSAAALLGAKWVDPALDAELIHDNRHPPAGIVVHWDVSDDKQFRSAVLPPPEDDELHAISVPVNATPTTALPNGASVSIGASLIPEYQISVKGTRCSGGPRSTMSQR